MTTADLYDASYYSGMRGADALYRQFVDLAGEFGALGDKRLLDVGCGRGDLLVQFVQAGVRNVFGMDFSAAAVQQAQALLTPLLGEAAATHVRPGSVTDASLYAPATFDVAFMTDVVEHLPDKDLHAGLVNVASWLKPGGVLVVHTFPTLGPHRIYRSLLRFTGKTEDLAKLDAIHCNVQTRASLHAALTRAGLDIERMFLRNDLVHTSSLYQRLPDGMIKTGLRLIFNDLLGSKPVAALLRGLGVAEYASPSIYAICRRGLTR